MINHCKLINNIFIDIYVCMYVETFSTAFTSLPLVMFFINTRFVHFHVIQVYIVAFFKSRRSSFVNLLYHHIHNSYHIAKQLYIDTAILAEQSLHHNIILEKLDHCWVDRICTNFSIYQSFGMIQFIKCTIMCMSIIYHFFLSPFTLSRKMKTNICFFNSSLYTRILMYFHIE